jgi:phage shock protein A
MLEQRKNPPAAPIKKQPPAPPVKKEPPAPPIKKSPAPASPEGDPHATKLTGVAAIQKFADDRKLKDLEAQAEEYKKRWEDTIGKGNKEATDKAAAVYAMLKKKHDEFKQEYDDKYFQATPRLSLQELSKRINQAKDEYEDAYGTPNQAAAKAKFDKAIADYEKAKGVPAPAASARGLKPEQDERIDKAAAATNRRIEKQINQRQFYDDATNAKIKAQNEARMAPFQKMNGDEKAALALYGQDGVKFYQQVNQLLRSGQMEDSSPDKVKMAEFISGNLRSGLEKLPPAKVEELQRAVSGNFAQGFGKLNVGDVIEDKGFGSYTNKGAPTLNQFIKTDQPNAVIRILNPRSAREVAPVMEYDSEGEHISLPGTKYRLVSVEEKGVHSRKTGGYIPQYTFEEVSE